MELVSTTALKLKFVLCVPDVFVQRKGDKISAWRICIVMDVWTRSRSVPLPFLSFCVDQTPTPTKFLKNCDEIGLFNELTVPKNPFDDAFKQATDEVKVGKKVML